MVRSNPRRRRVIGTNAWIKEQEEFWSDPTTKNRWLSLHEECARRRKEEQET
jgi:hypothetical protein